MKLFHSIATAVVALCLAAVCALFLWREYDYWAIAEYVAVVVAFPTCSLLHELGHILFGAMAKIKAEPHFRLFGSSGCDVVPGTENGLRARLIFTAIGGLAINLIFIVLGIISLTVAAVPVWLCVFLPASAYLFLLNAAPFVYSDGKTDGLVVRELATDSDEAKVALAVLKVQAQILSGKPVKDVEESLLTDLPQIPEDDPAFISLTELRYEYYEATGDDKKAAFYKKRFEDLKKEYM